MEGLGIRRRAALGTLVPGLNWFLAHSRTGTYFPVPHDYSFKQLVCGTGFPPDFPDFRHRISEPC